MALQAAQAGQLEFAVDATLGTSLSAISCAVNPAEVGGQILKAVQSLQEAAEAAAMCEDICRDIMHTAIARVPVVCKLLALGQLFSDSGDGVHCAHDAADLNAAMRQCCDFAFDALDAALTAMYSYLQCNKLSRLAQAASIKELIGEKRMQLRHRFDDVNAYMLLENVLSSQQSTQQAQHTTALVQQLQQQVGQLQHMQGADKARVKALAQATLARQSPEGQKIKISKEGVNEVAVSPSGDCFATAPMDGTAAVWDAATGTRMHELRGHSGGVCSVAWSPDGSRLATASLDKTAAVWDAATGTRMHELRGHRHDVCSIAWSPDGSRVATASEDQTAAVWDAATGTRMHELRGHRYDVCSIAWSPDGSRVATGSGDHTATVWDAATGTCMHELRGHKHWVCSVAWSPDGSRVATGSIDETAAVWDAATGTRMHELRGHSDIVPSIAWGVDGACVYTASGGNVRVYSIARRN